MTNQGHTPEIWLDEYEPEGKMDCGCRLVSAVDDHTPGAAFYQCPLHGAARDLLAACKAYVALYDALPSQSKSKCGFTYKGTVDEARAAISKAGRGQ